VSRRLSGRLVVGTIDPEVADGKSDKSRGLDPKRPAPKRPDLVS